MARTFQLAGVIFIISAITLIFTYSTGAGTYVLTVMLASGITALLSGFLWLTGRMINTDNSARSEKDGA